MKIQSQRPEETQAFAREIAQRFPDVKVWLLYGDLAAGKTTFAKGLSAELKSPTFTLINEHEAFTHCDLYRLENLDETVREQIEEAIEAQKHVLVEWPEAYEPFLKVPHLKIRFTHEGGDRRKIEVEDYSSRKEAK